MRIKTLHKKRISDKECQYAGETYGRLTVQCYLNDRAKNGQQYVLAICECGNRVKTLMGDLKAGKSKSCGCSRKKPLQLGDKIKVGWQEMYYFQFLAYTKISPKEVEERRGKGESLREMYLSVIPDDDKKKLALIRKPKKRKQKNYYKHKTPRWQRLWRKKRENEQTSG